MVRLLPLLPGLEQISFPSMMNHVYCMTIALIEQDARSGAGQAGPKGGRRRGGLNIKNYIHTVHGMRN